MDSKNYKAFALFLLATLLLLQSTVMAQADLRLQIVDVNTDGFPLMRVMMLTSDGRSQPISDLSSLSLRENGIPISDLSVVNVPVGVDVTFVIDANSRIHETGGDGGSRLGNIQASIRRFANQFMQPTGLDTVSVIVPSEDGQNGRFLIQNITTANELVTAVDGYAPQSPAQTPLDAMLDMALTQAAEREGNGRFQAILLFSDSQDLDLQLSFVSLAARANDANTPIFTAVLGVGATQDALANAQRLSETTRASFVRMADPTETDAIYRLWQQQGTPPQIQYRSLQNQSSSNNITINLDTALASTIFEVALAAPEVQIAIDRDIIRRAGDAFDTPLEQLQPTTQPIPVQINWPNGRPHRLTAVTLLANGIPQPLAELSVPEADGTFVLDWDIQALEAGAVALQVLIADELGFESSSGVLNVTVELERPLPPTPNPDAQPIDLSITLTQNQRDLLIGVGIFALAALLLLQLKRHKKEEKAAAQKIEAALPVPDAPEASPDEEGEDDDQSAILQQVVGTQTRDFPLPSRFSQVIIGRDPQNAQIVLADASVARLHARIKKSNGRYWLFDEGTPAGTYLNHQRLGLSPHPLKDGDSIKLGSVTLRFISKLKTVQAD